MDGQAILIQAIHATEGLPVGLIERAGQVKPGDRETYGEDHFKWLEAKIQKFSAIDPAKAEELKRSRAALQPFANVTLLWGLILTDDMAFSVWVQPEAGKVIHWQRWGETKLKNTLKMIQLAGQLKELEAKKKKG